jgi:hypothetical protein
MMRNGSVSTIRFASRQLSRSAALRFGMANAFAIDSSRIAFCSEYVPRLSMCGLSE